MTVDHVKDWYPLTNDVIFKKFFIEHTDLLTSFLCTILHIDQSEVTGIKVVNSESTPQFANGKLIRFDILLSTVNQKINIEMQNVNHYDFVERVLYYWSRMYAEELKIGDTYEKLKKSISINILNYKMFNYDDDKNPQKENKYLSSFSIYEDQIKTLLTDKMQLFFIELPKVNKKTDAKNIIKLWLQFIKAKNQKDLKMLNDTEIPEIQKAVETLNTINNDQKTRVEAWTREKAINDYISEMAHAEEKGIEKGRKEGIEQGRKEGVEQGRKEGVEQGRKEGVEQGRKEGVEQGRKEGVEEGLLRSAKGMKQNGIDLNLIAKISGLSLAEIEKL